MMVCVPTPAVAGLNTPIETPVPLYVPPVGEPPPSVIVAPLRQTSMFAGQVTVGNAFTVMMNVQVFVQPPLVYVYVIVCGPTPAVAGVNMPPDTPAPLYVPPVGVAPVNA